MKLAFCKYGNPAQLLPMRRDEEVFYRGGSMYPGYLVSEEIEGVEDLAGVCEQVASDMYEGHFCSGSYDRFSYAVLAESPEEADHLQSHCGNGACHCVSSGCTVRGFRQDIVDANPELHPNDS